MLRPNLKPLILPHQVLVHVMCQTQGYGVLGLNGMRKAVKRTLRLKVQTVLWLKPSVKRFNRLAVKYKKAPKWGFFISGG